MPITYNARTVTATSDGLTTGLIYPSDGGGFLTVNSTADYIITLPSSDDIPIGWRVDGWVTATAVEMRTEASSGETINGVDSDGTNEAAIPATSLFRVQKVAADTFILEVLDEGGDDITAPVPD